MKRYALPLFLPLLCCHTLAHAQTPAPRVPSDVVILYIPSEVPTQQVLPVALPVAGKPKVTMQLNKSFVENFDSVPALANGDGKAGKWAAHYDGGYDTVSKLHTGYGWSFKRTQNGANEQQIYVDPALGKLGLQPFSVSDSVLTITAQRSDEDHYDKLWGYPFTSGLLSAHQLYAQKYGYFEMRAQVPAGSNLLPAFWMLPVDRTWPPEIDIMEAPASYPNQISQGNHWRIGTTNYKHGMKTLVPDSDKAMHTYGALWLADRIVFYIDRVAVSQTATKADQHKPFYMMANLAVGGDWVGWVKPSDTSFPRTMGIDWIVAYTDNLNPCVKAVDTRGVTICEKK